MADAAAIWSSRANSARILVVRLPGAMTHTMPVSAWAARDCPAAQVSEFGDLKPTEVAWVAHDYLFLMASQMDGAEARLWARVAREEDMSAVMVSIYKDAAASLEEFGQDWDAFFVSRSGVLHTPLPLFVAERVVGYDDADLFQRLRRGIAVVHSTSRADAIPNCWLDEAQSVIAHFTMEAGSDPELKPLTLGEVDARWAALAQMPDSTEGLLSVGIHCHAPSALLLFRIRDWGGLA